MWSEYKVSFCNSNTTLDFLFSRGFHPTEMHTRYFTFDPFQNHKSHDLETSHIGFLQSKQIQYMPEERFEVINKMLADISIDTFEYAFSRQDKGRDQDTCVILKRGAYLRFMGNQFRFRIDFGSPLGHIDFDPVRGDAKMCRLDLVKIVNDERVGWVPFEKFAHLRQLAEDKAKEVRKKAPVVPDVPFDQEVPLIPVDEPQDFSREEVLNATLKRTTLKEAVNKFKQTYHQIRDDVKHREIRNGWLN